MISWGLRDLWTFLYQESWWMHLLWYTYSDAILKHDILPYVLKSFTYPYALYYKDLYGDSLKESSVIFCFQHEVNAVSPIGLYNDTLWVAKRVLYLWEITLLLDRISTAARASPAGLLIINYSLWAILSFIHSYTSTRLSKVYL